MKHTISKETSQYIEALGLIDKGTDKISETLNEIYGERMDSVIEPYLEAIRKARSEVYRLIEANIDNNLGTMSKAI